MNYSYKYARPAVTTDIILLKELNLEIYILLIKRLNNPYKNHWALPGGFVDENENLIDAAKRELKEETNINNISLNQFKTYGEPGRDPRGHTISIVYYSILKQTILDTKAGDDAKEVKWFNIKQLPELAFDHAVIINEAITELL